jgi:hypothetical protein
MVEGSSFRRATEHGTGGGVLENVLEFADTHGGVERDTDHPREHVAVEHDEGVWLGRGPHGDTIAGGDACVAEGVRMSGGPVAQFAMRKGDVTIS